MKKSISITALFLDIGGVLLTKGREHQSRKLAANVFVLDLAAMNGRHHRTFDTYEVGKLRLEDYLCRVVFYQKRPFTPAQFQKFMFAQSKQYPEMTELVSKLKAKQGLNISVVRAGHVARIAGGRWKSFHQQSIQ